MAEFNREEIDYEDQLRQSERERGSLTVEYQEKYLQVL